ncbi:hypothetical protein HPB50_006696 [Hyalomma asiaticum]|uniref:Uncharacterized protein n=1 Tax=Hyalomma asiaticum TaxID=266040 RepID=A0ACB7TJG2_HYAAI|nr:hypothetical protein HPB50_006696 [Hyalomma asiaticum]
MTYGKRLHGCASTTIITIVIWGRALVLRATSLERAQLHRFFALRGPSPTGSWVPVLPRLRQTCLTSSPSGMVRRCPPPTSRLANLCHFPAIARDRHLKPVMAVTPAKPQFERPPRSTPSGLSPPVLGLPTPSTGGADTCCVSALRLRHLPCPALAAWTPRTFPNPSY